MKANALTYDRAIACLQRPNARMVRVNGRGSGYYIVPGGPVDDPVALRLMTHPLVRSERDGLWTDCPQTWRLFNNR
jgi:hypothetical protein